MPHRVAHRWRERERSGQHAAGRRGPPRRRHRGGRRLVRLTACGDGLRGACLRGIGAAAAPPERHRAQRHTRWGVHARRAGGRVGGKNSDDVASGLPRHRPIAQVHPRAPTPSLGFLAHSTTPHARRAAPPQPGRPGPGPRKRPSSAAAQKHARSVLLLAAAAPGELQQPAGRRCGAGGERAGVGAHGGAEAAAGGCARVCHCIAPDATPAAAAASGAGRPPGHARGAGLAGGCPGAFACMPA
jgi:hypothetical protein